MSTRLVPLLVAAGLGESLESLGSLPNQLTLGIVSGIYIWKEPLEQVTDHGRHAPTSPLSEEEVKARMAAHQAAQAALAEQAAAAAAQRDSKDVKDVKTESKMPLPVPRGKGSER